MIRPIARNLFTEDEFQVLQLETKGFTNLEISGILGVDRATIRTWRKRIRNKEIEELHRKGYSPEQIVEQLADKEEAEVLRLRFNGWTTRDITDRLFIDSRRLDDIERRIKRKMTAAGKGISNGGKP
jgi:DNA-binding NarL/FixJ family response regulator